MAKKREKIVEQTKEDRETLNIRCTAEDLELFNKAAEADGFIQPSGKPNRSAWMLNRLRKIAKQVVKQDE